jgi:hypothetical protein
MADKPINIYSNVAFDLNKKIANFIEELNNSNQIDLGDDGYPYLISVNRVGPNFVVHIVRNNKIENFILNTRKRKGPITSWSPEDGYQRRGGRKVVSVDTSDGAPRRERQKRSYESFERLTDQILKD